MSNLHVACCTNACFIVRLPYFLMKKFISLTLILLTTTLAFSQKIVDRKRRLTSHVIERYHAIIGDKKEVKEGEYKASYKDALIAQGQYKDDKRVGIWH